MFNLLRRAYTVRYAYENPLDMQRARGLLVVTEALFVLWLFWTLVFIVQNAAGSPLTDINAYLPTTLIIPLLISVYFFVQTGRLRVASWLIVLYLFFSVGFLNASGFDSLVTTFMFLPLVLAGLLLGRRGALIVALLFIGYLALSATMVADIDELQIRDRAANVPVNLAVVGSALMFITATLYAFSGNAQVIVRQWSTFMRQYNIINRFAQENTGKDEATIYQQAITLLRQEFGFVFVQVYLVDDTGKLTRRVRTGSMVEGEQAVTAVTVPESSVLAEAGRRGETLTVTPYDNELRRRHLLPSVNIGVAVPFFVGDKVAGVLDLQTNDANFSTQATQVVDAFANQLGGVIHEARVVNALRRTVREQEVLNEHLREQLQQMQQSGITSGENVWVNYMQQRGTQTLGYDFNAKTRQVQPAENLPSQLRDALKDGQVHIEQHADGQTMLIPILLRDEVLGAMTFDAPRITDSQRDMAQQVANRLALALENKRLFEQSQAQANRERRAGEAAELLISATEVDAVLNLAATTFNEAMGAVKTRIHLAPEVMAQHRANEEER